MHSRQSPRRAEPRPPLRRLRVRGRPAGAISEETRARILASACRCFARSGYSHTSNRDIAREAGVTTGALYHYFDSKAELFAAVHRWVQAVLIEVYQRAFAERGSEGCVEQLVGGLEAALALTAAEPELTHFAATAALEIERHPELAPVTASVRDDARLLFERLLREAERRGELAPGVEVGAVVDLLVSTLFGLAWLRSQVRRLEDYEAAIRAFQRLLRAAVFRR